MNLTKLVSLLQTKALSFTRADRTGGPYEGSYPPAQKAARAAALARFDPKAKFDDLVAVGGIASHVLYAENIRRGHFLNCWHASAEESLAMWKLYAGREAGVAVVSSYRRLVDSINARTASRSDRPLSVIVSLVSYGGDRPLPEGNGLHPYLTKHPSLEYEHELRAIGLSGGGLGVDVAVELATLVDRIHVAPESPTSFLEVVHGLVKIYELPVEVTRYKIDRDPVF